MSASKSGIQTSADGNSYIPASKRADGSTRKEIRVRPGYRPPEDVEKYKNRSAEAWKSRGSSGVPGAEDDEKTKEDSAPKSKNAKRREASKRKQDAEALAKTADGDLIVSLDGVDLSAQDQPNNNKDQPRQPVIRPDTGAEVEVEAEAERQKKVRNQLKKLRAVRELKDKKVSGEKLSHDQLMKISKEEELLRDLKKLNYDGPELGQGNTDLAATTEENAG